MADMTDATKRKEPEAEEAKPVEAKAEGSKPAAVKAEEPEAKRAKVANKPADPAVIRKQVEYYLSDENLKCDRFFSEKIASDKDGWLEMSLILSCNKMKALRCSPEDVVAALKDSKLELKDAGAAVRRPANAALPSLEAKPQHHQKKMLHAHDGGAVIVFKNVPAEQSWVQIKEALAKTLPPKVNIWFCSEVNDKSQCFAACPPFDGDLHLFEGMTLEVGSAKLKAEVCYGEALQAVLKNLPKHIRDKRERESKKRQKERNRPIVIGSQKFVNVGALRGKVKEIMNSRSDGEQLKPEGTDFKLIKALLDYHPKGAEKSKGMTGIKVAKSQQGDSRCFYMVKEDGADEDVSVKKCIDAIELDPPYVKVEKKAAAEGEEKAAVAGEEKKAAAEAEPASETKEEAKAEAASATKEEATAASATEEEAKAEAAGATKEEARPASEPREEAKAEEQQTEEEKPAASS